MGRASRADVAPFEAALARLTGARLCYGKPVRVGQRTVVPVASVRTIGAFGYGRGEDAAGGAGGGGAGTLDARPVGFIEITPEGTSYQSISDRRLTLATIGGGALAALVMARSRTRRRRSGIEVGRRLAIGRGTRSARLPYRSSQRS